MKQKLNRLERVLLTIIRELSFTTVLGPYAKGTKEWSSDIFSYPDREGYYLHLAPWAEPKPGMIVYCETSGIHPWTVAEVVEVIDPSTCILRCLRDGTLLRMYNEGFRPIIGLDTDDLMTDEQYDFESKVRKAFWKLDHYWHVYGGMEFDGNVAIIHVREKWGGSMSLSNRLSVPYDVKMEWGKRTTIKSIKQALLDAGYGDRKFEAAITPDSISVKRGVVQTPSVEFDFDSLTYHKVNAGHDFRFWRENRMRLRPPDIGPENYMAVNIEAKNGEWFAFRGKGIVGSQTPDYYKPGVIIIVSGIDIQPMVTDPQPHLFKRWEHAFAL